MIRSAEHITISEDFRLSHRRRHRTAYPPRSLLGFIRSEGKATDGRSGGVVPDRASDPPDGRRGGDFRPHLGRALPGGIGSHLRQQGSHLQRNFLTPSCPNFNCYFPLMLLQLLSHFFLLDELHNRLGLFRIQFVLWLDCPFVFLDEIRNRTCTASFARCSSFPDTILIDSR